MRLPDPSAKSLDKFHLMMMNVWAVLAIPTLLWWKESILWVAMMSLYANFVGHFASWDGARAELKNEETQCESG